MAELVDVLGLRGDPLLERRHGSLGTPSGPGVKRTPARVKSEAITALGSAAPRSSSTPMSRLSAGSRRDAVERGQPFGAGQHAVGAVGVDQRRARTALNGRRDAASATSAKTAPQA